MIGARVFPDPFLGKSAVIIRLKQKLLRSWGSFQHICVDEPESVVTTDWVIDVRGDGTGEFDAARRGKQFQRVYIR